MYCGTSVFGISPFSKDGSGKEEKPISVVHRVFILIFIFFLALGSCVSIEWLTHPDTDNFQETYDPAPALGADGKLPDPFPHSERRMFILIVDSLSYDTAIDPDLMPHLNQLKSDSTYGYMKNSIDPVTAPSIKAAFTGKDEFSISSAATNWIEGHKVPSVFTQLVEVNLTISVYSDTTFKQFGDDITDYHYIARGSDDYPILENRTVKEAIQDTTNREHDIVIMHLLVPHDVVQKYGTQGDQFKKAFNDADETIGMIDNIIPEDETFLVFGDHGHDKDGRHIYGLDVPTYFNIRGPGFKKNNEERIVITDLRYFVSWAMGVPLPDNYEAGRYPTALVPNRDSDLPETYASEYHPLDDPEDMQTRISSDMLPIFFLTVFYLSLLIGICSFFLFKNIEEIPVWQKVLSLVALFPLYIPFLQP